MRSRAVRWTSSVLAVMALGGAALFLWQSQRQLIVRQAEFEQFDRHAHEATAAIAGIRAAQRAYVAPGQNPTTWMIQVKSLSDQVAAQVDQLRSLAASSDARQALLAASASVSELGAIDKRARDYVTGDQGLMASDVVFSDGNDTVSDVETQLTAALNAERATANSANMTTHKLQALAAASSAVFAALVVLWLAPAPREVVRTVSAPDETSAVSDADALSLKFSPPPAAAAPPAPVAVIEPDEPPREAVALSSAADVCTAFGRVQDVNGLKHALSLAANAMDASGIVVWLGNADGADLRPVVAYGYSDPVLALMRSVPKAADNAAAAAYRTSKLQIVPAKPGTSLGAIVAPILSADGCIGALTAEIKDNGEVSDTLHAMATIFASQLAGVLSPTTQAAAPPSQAASA